MVEADDFKKFSEQYIQSCKEQISALANNPKMLEKALEPFMKMQQEYMDNPENAGILSAAEEGSTDKNNSSNSNSLEDIFVMLQKISHRIQGMRKKVLPELAERINRINVRLSNIEQHLGIQNDSADDEDTPDESYPEKEEN